MIDFSRIDILRKNISTLKECSLDDSSDKPPNYMTYSELSAVNFDKVKDKYVTGLHLNEIPKSNDSLFVDNNGNPTFIEFKSGNIKDKEKFNVRGKILDSMLIFTDIIGYGISYTRENMDYILVYNEEKNENNIDKEELVQNSTSRDKIAKNFASKAKEPFISFGLERFKNYCFKNVFTYTQSEFEEHFVNKRVAMEFEDN